MGQALQATLVFLLLGDVGKDADEVADAPAIVMHGAAYVDADNGRRMGRLGRSWGCPALRKAVAKPIIDVMKEALLADSSEGFDDNW